MFSLFITKGTEMGRASKAKRIRRQVEDIQVTAVSENGQSVLEKYGANCMQEAAAEIFAQRMVRPRALVGEGGEIFVYDLENSRCETPLQSLVEQLQKNFGRLGQVPNWLVPLVIEEPWEHAYGGHTVRLRDVANLYSQFGLGIDAVRGAWELVEKYACKRAAELEAEILGKETASASISRRPPRL